jgi:hypothetical protein
MSTIAILGLALILIIGFARFMKERKQDSPVKENEKNSESVELKSEEAPFQTTQRIDESYYEELFVSKETPDSSVPVEEKKAKAPKKTAAKKDSTKKPVSRKKKTEE